MALNGSNGNGRDAGLKAWARSVEPVKKDVAPGKLKIGIEGVRTYDDYETFCEILDEYYLEGQIEEIISGGATGADELARWYARDTGLPIREFKADWKRYGRAAGPIRNQFIVEACDLLIAFWDGESRGTKSAIRIAAELGKETRVIRIDQLY